MGTLVILLFVPALVFILLILSPVLSISPIGGVTDKKYYDKMSAYECGLTALPGQTKGNLTVAFYIVAILYLVFDLEIALLIPIVSSSVTYPVYTAALLFIAVLTIGFFYELGSGALNWSKIGM